MKLVELYFSGLITLVAAAGLVGCASPGSEQATALFDGQSLQGWSQRGLAKWNVQEGELRTNPSAGDGLLVSNKQFGNFRLSLEFWVEAETNSGVLIRCQDPTMISPDHCYEINIWDEHPRQEYRTGAIVKYVYPPLVHVDSVGQWNRYEITAKDDHIIVMLNGVKTAELTDQTYSTGVIALQRYKTGQVRFRNISIEPL